MEFNYDDFYNSLTATEKKFAPKDLWIVGNPMLLFSGLKVAIVGSRKPSAQGIANAQCIAQKLVEHGVVVVSGLADGIDTVAHETAIQYGGKTIAVLGTPLDVAYPAKNASLLNNIKKDHLAISQFQQGYPVKKENFPMRNRTMALLSDATIIIEASENSGTRHLGWESLRLGRFTFLLKDVMMDQTLSWPKEMAKYGAQELTCELLPSFLEAIPNVTYRSDYASFY